MYIHINTIFPFQEWKKGRREGRRNERKMSDDYKKLVEQSSEVLVCNE